MNFMASHSLCGNSIVQRLPFRGFGNPGGRAGSEFAYVGLPFLSGLAFFFATFFFAFIVRGGNLRLLTGSPFEVANYEEGEKCEA
jgi:hypothetical protein